MPECDDHSLIDAGIALQHTALDAGIALQWNGSGPAHCKEQKAQCTMHTAMPSTMPSAMTSAVTRAGALCRVEIAVCTASGPNADGSPVDEQTNQSVES